MNLKVVALILASAQISSAETLSSSSNDASFLAREQTLNMQTMKALDDWKTSLVKSINHRIKPCLDFRMAGVNVDDELLLTVIFRDAIKKCRPTSFEKDFQCQLLHAIKEFLASFYLDKDYEYGALDKKSLGVLMEETTKKFSFFVDSLLEEQEFSPTRTSTNSHEAVGPEPASESATAPASTGQINPTPKVSSTDSRPRHDQQKSQPFDYQHLLVFLGPLTLFGLVFSVVMLLRNQGKGAAVEGNNSNGDGNYMAYDQGNLMANGQGNTMTPVNANNDAGRDNSNLQIREVGNVS